MNKLYNKQTWHNNTTPAINEDNLNHIEDGIDAIDSRLVEISGTLMDTIPEILEMYDDIETLTKNPPYIGSNGNWFVWDTETGAYVDSGVDASITVTIADVTMLPTGSQPYVTNTGTNTDPVFHLFIPYGDIKVTGVKGSAESTYRTGNINITKANIGLGNVDNTSDASKPVSTATQIALNGKLDKAGGTMSGDIVLGNNEGGGGSITVEQGADWYLGTRQNPIHSGYFDDAEIIYDLSVGDNLDVGDDATVGGDLAVAGAATVTGDLTTRDITARDITTEDGLEIVDQQGNLRFELDSDAEIDGTNVDTAPTSGSKHIVTSGGVYTALNGKVDKVAGKGLSTNDYTDTEKTKLAGIESGAQVNVVTSVAGKTGAVSLEKSDVGLGNVPNVTTDNQTPTVTQVSTRSNLATGDTLKTIVGKIKKWFSDLGDLAFLNKDGASSTKFLRGDGTWQTVASGVTGVKGGAESSYRTGNVNLTKANIGLGNVDNTSDASKPVSTATQTALNGKFDKTGGRIDGDITLGGTSENPACIFAAHSDSQIGDPTNPIKTGYFDRIITSDTIEADGNISTTMHLDVGGNATIDGNLEVSGDLSTGNIDNSDHAVTIAGVTIEKDADDHETTVTADNLVGDTSASTAEFTQASTRANINSGESMGTLFGKIKKWFADLGTAAFKNVPSSGNASTTEVVLGDDTRLSDARNAADVSAWAKAASKPTYTKSEVGLGNVDNTSDLNKPISTATQTALNGKADTSSLTDGSVTKIGTGNVGSATQPVYINGGVPTAVNYNINITSQADSTIETLVTQIKTKAITLSPGAYSFFGSWNSHSNGYQASVVKGEESATFWKVSGTVYEYAQGRVWTFIDYYNPTTQAWGGVKIRQISGITTGTPTSPATGLSFQSGGFAVKKTGNVVTFRVVLEIGSGYTPSTSTTLFRLPFTPESQFCASVAIGKGGVGYEYALAYVYAGKNVTLASTAGITKAVQGNVIQVYGTYMTND